MSHLMVDLEPLQSVDFRIQTREMTREQYLAFIDANPDLRIEHTACGEVIVMPPASSRTSAQNTDLTAQLLVWARREGNGIAFGADAGFDLPNGANRGPDASWVQKSRVAALRDEERKVFLRLCPDFAVELRSPSDRLTTEREKMREYIDNGAKLAWLIDPKHRRVHVFRPGAQEQILENPGSVSGEPELPGFTLDLTHIWNPDF